MTYTFPPSLHPLRDFLKKQGFDGDAVKTSRQAAFVAQQLLGSRIRFPPAGSDMTSTLFLIQKAVTEKGIASTYPLGRKLPETRQKVPAKKGKKAGLSTAPNHHKEFSDDMFAAGVHVFCDGACEPNPGAGGWGVVIYRDGVEIASSCGGDPNATNNTMELTALLNAIEKTAHVLLEPPAIPITVWCDSQYCVKGCNDWRHGWKKNGWQRGSDKAQPKNRILANADLWRAIDEALADLPPGRVSICWVKGHVGIVGNERADELSSLGRQQALKQTRLDAAPPALAIPVDESGQSASFRFAPVDIGEN